MFSVHLNAHMNIVYVEKTKIHVYFYRFIETIVNTIITY